MLAKVAVTALILGLLAAPASALAADAGDTAASASGPLEAGLEVRDAIASDTDDDWFVLYTDGPGTVRVRFTALGPRGCFAPEMVVYDAEGRRVGRAHPPGGFAEEVQAPVTGRTRLLVQVRQYTIEPCPPDTSDFAVEAGPQGLLTPTPPPGPPGIEQGGDVPPAWDGGTMPAERVPAAPSVRPVVTVTGSTSPVTAAVGVKARRSGLRLDSATRRRGVLRLRGRLVSKLDPRRLEVRVDGRRVTARPRRVGTRAWTASVALRGAARSTRALVVRVRFAGDRTYAPAIVQRRATSR